MERRGDEKPRATPRRIILVPEVCVHFCRTAGAVTVLSSSRHPGVPNVLEWTKERTFRLWSDAVRTDRTGLHGRLSVIMLGIVLWGYRGLPGLAFITNTRKA